MIYSAVVCTPDIIFLGHTMSSSSIFIYSNSKVNSNSDINSSTNPFVYIGQYLNIVGPANSLKLNGSLDRLLVTTISGHFTVFDSSQDMIERIKLLFQDHEYNQDYIPEAKRLGLVYHHTPQYLGQTDFASFLPDGRSIIVTGRTLSDIYIFSCKNDIHYTMKELNLSLDSVESFGQITDISINNNYLAISSSTSHILVIDYIKRVIIYSQKLSDTYTEITSLHWRVGSGKSSHLSLAGALCNGFVKITVFKIVGNQLEYDTTLQYKILEIGTIRKVLCREHDILASIAGKSLLDDKIKQDVDGKFTSDSNHNIQFGLILQYYKDGKITNERVNGHIHNEPILDFYSCNDIIISCSKNTTIATIGNLIYKIN